MHSRRAHEGCSAAPPPANFSGARNTMTEGTSNFRFGTGQQYHFKAPPPPRPPPPACRMRSIVLDQSGSHGVMTFIPMPKTFATTLPARTFRT